jgi:hypothetical protein
MQIKKRLLAAKRAFSLSMSELSGYRRKPTQRKRPSVHPHDSELEAQRRRRLTGGSFEDTLERLWSQTTEPREVAKLLRPTTREEKVEAIQRKEEKEKARNLQLTEISRRPGWNVLIAFLSRIERGGYANLRHPEHRKTEISVDYFTGFQNGTIETVETIRAMMVEAVLKHYKDQHKKDERNT